MIRSKEVRKTFIDMVIIDRTEIVGRAKSKTALVDALSRYNALNQDWVCQENTRLATARDKSTERGLTRAEVTFYVKDGKIPTEEEIESVLFKIVEYIPKELVFSTHTLQSGSLTAKASNTL